MKKLEFQRKIKYNPRPIIVDLWAPWCSPCKAMAPGFKEVSQKYSGQVDVLKINVDESLEVMKELGVMSIPTVIGFAKGEEILRRTGMQTQGMLEFFFETTLSQKKPAIMPPAPAARLFRTILGLAVAALGWFVGHSIWIVIVGGIVVFSGYYDRCPILRAIAPRIKTLFQPSKKVES
ncbi:MAG: thioredoxin domain-containing protein [Chloroflexi bacterium]|nr:thioredoxin domain-containing protein [Chloroflexota bacterium]